MDPAGLRGRDSGRLHLRESDGGGRGGRRPAEPNQEPEDMETLLRDLENLSEEEAAERLSSFGAAREGRHERSRATPGAPLSGEEGAAREDAAAAACHGAGERGDPEARASPTAAAVVFPAPIVVPDAAGGERSGLQRRLGDPDARRARCGRAGSGYPRPGATARRATDAFSGSQRRALSGHSARGVHSAHALRLRHRGPAARLPHGGRVDRLRPGARSAAPDGGVPALGDGPRPFAGDAPHHLGRLDDRRHHP